MTSRHLRRTVAVATAALTTLAIAAPGAHAAPSGPDVFAGEAQALAAELTVTAPQQLIGSVTDGANTLTQKVSFTTSNLSSEDVANATTTLLDGLLTEGNLSSSKTTDSQHQAIAERNVNGILQVGAGTVDYAVDAAKHVSHSASELAHLKVSIAPLFADGAVPAEAAQPLQDAVGQVTDTVNGLVDQLNGALGQVQSTLEETAGQVVDIPKVTPDEVPHVPDVTSVDLVDIRKLWSDSTVTTTGDLVTSTAKGGIASASLLGGLIQVPALEYTSWAKTAGTPGSADAGTDITTIAVKVGDEVVKVAGEKLSVGDFTLDLNDPSLSGVPADQILGPVTDVLGQIVNAAGLSISQGQGTKSIADDGSSASATTSAFALNLAPLHAAGQDQTLAVALNLLPTKAAVSGAPAPAAAPASPNLPRTGGGALAMVFGSLAMGGAALLRRRH